MNESPLSKTTLDFSSCNQEKVHNIGSIQSQGVLFIVNYPSFRIQAVSRNVHTFTGGDETSALALVGQKLQKTLDPLFFETIEMRLKSGALKETDTFSFEWQSEDKNDVFIYRIDAELIGIEIEPQRESFPHASIASKPLNEHIQKYVQLAKDAPDLENLSAMVCRGIRALTGMNRVMMYRFSPSWHGEVIAEDRSAEAHSFLHHHFPASDIPKPARDLYLKNGVRSIYNSADESVEIYPQSFPGSTQAIDLSNSRLRAVSKIHLEYLKNMGVKSSFSVAVVVDGRLWGLIACHSTQLNYVPHSIRSATLTLANLVALQASLIEKNQILEEKTEFNERLEKLILSLQSSPQAKKDLFNHFAAVSELFNCKGMALISNKEIDLVGLTPNKPELQKLAELLKERMKESGHPVVETNHLASVDPSFKDFSKLASGVIAIAIPAYYQSIFMLFRPEYLQTVLWGGDPRKSVDSRNYTGPINPRASFESWEEKVRDQSQLFKEYQIKGLEFLKAFVFDHLLQKEHTIDELGKQLATKINS